MSQRMENGAINRTLYPLVTPERPLGTLLGSKSGGIYLFKTFRSDMRQSEAKKREKQREKQAEEAKAIKDQLEGENRLLALFDFLFTDFHY
jgi:hypothetical protein